MDRKFNYKYFIELVYRQCRFMKIWGHGFNYIYEAVFIFYKDIFMKTAGGEVIESSVKLL